MRILGQNLKNTKLNCNTKSYTGLHVELLSFDNQGGFLNEIRIDKKNMTLIVFFRMAIMKNADVSLLFEIYKLHKQHVKFWKNHSGDINSNIM